MRFNLGINFWLINLSLILASCSTVIGGDYSTAEASGARLGPATIAMGNGQVENDRLDALTVTGNLVASELIIGNDLQVESNAKLIEVKVGGVSQIGGNLEVSHCKLQQVVTVANQLNSYDCYFGNDVVVGGSQILLQQHTKIAGNLISRSKHPTTIILDHSQVKGNINFTNSPGMVILRNKSKLQGKVYNGNLRQEK